MAIWGTRRVDEDFDLLGDDGLVLVLVVLALVELGGAAGCAFGGGGMSDEGLPTCKAGDGTEPMIDEKIEVKED